MKQNRLLLFFHVFMLAVLGLITVSCKEDDLNDNGLKLKVPQGFAADALGTTQTSVRLTWKAVDSDDVAGYTVAYALDGVDNFHEKECFETETSISKLRPQTNYVFMIRANSHGAVENNSDWSAPIKVSTLAPVVPDVPTNFRSIDDEISSTRIGLAWDPVEGAEKYVISYKRKQDEEFLTFDTESPQIILNALDVHTQYSVKVQAWSEIGFSESSPTLQVSTLSRSEGIFNADDFGSFSVGPADGGEWKNASNQVVIRRDIDMAGIEWTPMPEFTGVLDGNGKTITNLAYAGGGGSENEFVGLIAVLKGTVKNLTLGADCTFESRRTSNPVSAEQATKAGAFAAVVKSGGLEDCTSYAIMKTGTGCNYIGGLIGLAKPNDETTSIRITNCFNKGTVSVAGNIICDRSGQFINIGGIAGAVESGVSVSDCHNEGTVSSANTALAKPNRLLVRIGGIAGFASNSSVSDCSNEQAARIEIKANPHYSRIGGIVGYAQGGGSFTNCNNYGVFDQATEASDPDSEFEVGGIIGRAEKGYGTDKIVVANNCENHSDLTITAHPGANKLVTVGGIVGYLAFDARPFEVTDCHNEGNFHVTAATSTSLMGGILGGIEAKSSGLVSECTNSGNITSILASNKAFHVGGIVGVNKSATTTVRKCSNTGNLDITNKLKAYGGGIIGEAQGCTVDNCTNTGYIHALFNEGDVAHIGGIVSRSYRGVTITGCTNHGNIVYGGSNPKIGDPKTGGFGGIIGYLDKDATVDGCTNTGTVLGDTKALGKRGSICGLAAVDGANCVIKNCVVQGAIGTYDSTAADLGVSSAEQINADNFSHYIYGDKVNGLTETDNVFSK